MPYDDADSPTEHLFPPEPATLDLKTVGRRDPVFTDPDETERLRELNARAMQAAGIGPAPATPPVNGIASRFMRASDVVDNWGVNALIYGKPGSGKTSLCASAQDTPRGADVFLIDFDAGTRTIANRSDITIFQPRTFAEIRDVYSYLTTEPHTYQTIILDTLTEAQRICMAEVMLTAKNPELPSLADYGKVNERLTRMIRNFRALSVSRGWNVVFTAHEVERTDPQSNITGVGPALTPAAAVSVTGILDLVGHLTVDKEEGRHLRISQTPTVTAKIRQPASAKKIPPVLDNPTFGEILDLLATINEPA